MKKIIIILIFLLSLNFVLADDLIWRLNFSDGLQASLINETGASGTPLFTTGASASGNGITVLKTQFNSINGNYYRYDFPTPIEVKDFETMYLQFDFFCPAGGTNYWDFVLSGDCSGDLGSYTNEQIHYSWFDDCLWDCASNLTACTKTPTFGSNSFFTGINLTFSNATPNTFGTQAFYQQGNQPTSFDNRTNFWRDVFGNWDTTSIECLYIGDSRNPDSIFNMEFANFELWNTTPNTLPDFNVTINHGEICFNSTVQNAIIPINITAFDNDGDTILYALNPDTQLKSLYATNFDLSLNLNPLIPTCSPVQWLSNFLGLGFVGLGVCGASDLWTSAINNINEEELIDFDFVWRSESQCSMDSPFFHNDRHNFSIRKTSALDDIYSNALILDFDTCDENDESLIYTIPSIATRQHLFSLSLVFENTDDNYTVEYHDTDNQNVPLRYLIFDKFENNTINVSYYTNDSKVNIGKFNLNVVTNSLILGLYKRADGITEIRAFTNNLENETSELIINTTIPNLNNVSFKKFVINASEGLLALDNIEFGSISIIDWSSEKPTQIINNKLGNQQNILYVTDTVHQGTDYKFEILNVNVLPETYCSDIDLDKGDDLLTPYENVKGLTGVSLILDKFVWFIQYPYKLAKLLGLEDEVKAALLVTQLLYVPLYLAQPLTIGTEKTFGGVIVRLFFMNVALMFMKLTYIPIFILVSILFSFVVLGTISNKDTVEGGQ